MKKNKWPIVFRIKSLVTFFSLLFILYLITTYLLHDQFGFDINKPCIPSSASRDLNFYAFVSFSVLFLPALFLCWGLIIFRFNKTITIPKREAIITLGLVFLFVGYYSAFIVPPTSSKFKGLIYDMQCAAPDGPFKRTDMSHFFDNYPESLNLLQLIPYKDSLATVAENKESELPGFIKSYGHPDSLDTLLDHIDLTSTSIKKRDIENHPNQQNPITLSNVNMETMIFTKVKILEVLQDRTKSVNLVIWRQLSVPILSVFLFLLGSVLGFFLRSVKLMWFFPNRFFRNPAYMANYGDLCNAIRS